MYCNSKNHLQTLFPLPQPGVVFLLSGVLLLPHPPQELRVGPGPLPVPPARLPGGRVETSSGQSLL